MVDYSSYMGIMLRCLCLDAKPRHREQYMHYPTYLVPARQRLPSTCKPDTDWLPMMWAIMGSPHHGQSWMPEIVGQHSMWIQRSSGDRGCGAGEPVYPGERERILGQKARRTQRLAARAARRSKVIPCCHSSSLLPASWQAGGTLACPSSLLPASWQAGGTSACPLGDGRAVRG